MAGDWIKMGAGLGRHPKVVRIASALKADRLRVVGGLHAVWCLFDEHSEDGQLSGYTAELVDEMIGWPGFMAALVSVEWAEADGENLSLPRFDAHNGQSAKRRAMEADRKREARKPSASKADAVRTREEKRREENTEAKEKATVQATPAQTEAFLNWWHIYPNKQSKLQAWKAWKKLRLDDRMEELMAHVRLMADCDDGWRRGYVPMGSTYLNQARWEDIPKQAPVNGAKPPSNTLQAIMNLGGKTNVDARGNKAGLPEIAMPRIGSTTGAGRVAGNGHGVGGDD